MATTVTAPRSDTVSDDRRGGAPRRDPQNARIAPSLFLAASLAPFPAFVVAPAAYGLWFSLLRHDFTPPNKPFVVLEKFT